jgi:hypothetical protein
MDWQSTLYAIPAVLVGLTAHECCHALPLLFIILIAQNLLDITIIPMGKAVMGLISFILEI